MSDSAPVRENLREPLSPFWRAPIEFAVHTLVGTAIFGIIAAPAVGIDIAVHKLEPYAISSVIINSLKAGEYALLTTDLILFGVFLWRTGRRTIRNL